MRWIVTMFAISILLLAGCSPVETASGPSGVEGQVTLAECYGDQVAEDCYEHQPYQVTLLVVDATGEEYARVETDEEGFFHIELPPGEYLLHPIRTAVYPVTLDVVFTVVKNNFTQVNVVFDSGVR